MLLAVPIGLVTTESTRRFGTYMILGMIVCAVVVVGVASAVIWTSWPAATPSRDLAASALPGIRRRLARCGRLDRHGHPSLPLVFDEPRGQASRRVTSPTSPSTSASAL